MTKLYSYTVRVDDGAAPNPFNNMCSLAICKPNIRRFAQQGDWIAGIGSRNARQGNLENCLVYAMKVDEVVSLSEYDRRAKEEWPHRIPNPQSLELQDRLGDCIYDYSNGEPVLRPSVHGDGNIKTDVFGENVLISRDYYYFGREAIELPNYLHPIRHQNQGHKSTVNEPYVERFVEWIRSLSSPHGLGQVGWPDFAIRWGQDGSCSPCTDRADDQDPECGLPDC